MTETDFRDILAEYEEIRERNSLTEEKRKKEVTEKLPEYRELEIKAAEVASFYGRKMIIGDEDARYQMEEELDLLAEKKASLLKNAGFPADYLEPVYDCPDCKDTGFTDTGKCHCLRQRIVNSLYLQSHIRDILKRENFDTCDLDRFSRDVRPDMEKVYNAARDFVNSFADTSRNMLFLGSVGSGKTFLTNCIAKELLDHGFSVVYFSAFRLFSLIADNVFGHPDIEDKSSFFSNIYESDLLIIDDLGTENTNSFVAGQLFNILNERGIRKKPTIISSNLSLESIKDIYSERSLSRIIGNYELYYFRGEDLRMKEKR
ncbi:MAG: ATP-binding protein [Lachnospiraceae bacterium]|nr:ATP-binding protein [Lachnospiraceae bacterium]